MFYDRFVRALSYQISVHFLGDSCLWDLSVLLYVDFHARFSLIAAGNNQPFLAVLFQHLNGLFDVFFTSFCICWFILFIPMVSALQVLMIWLTRVHVIFKIRFASQTQRTDFWYTDTAILTRLHCLCLDFCDFALNLLRFIYSYGFLSACPDNILWFICILRDMLLQEYCFSCV